MSMTLEESGEMVKYLGRLFPRWKVTPELALLWGQSIRNYPQSRVRAAMNQHAAETKREDPSLAVVMEKLRVWREANPGVVRSFAPSSTARTMHERCERYAEFGKDLWIKDGMPEQAWPAMEKTIKGWERTGKASLGTILKHIVAGESGGGAKPKRKART